MRASECGDAVPLGTGTVPAVGEAVLELHLQGALRSTAEQLIADARIASREMDPGMSVGATQISGDGFVPADLPRGQLEPLLTTGVPSVHPQAERPSVARDAGPWRSEEALTCVNDG